MSVNNDYKSLWNQQKLNSANALLGGSSANIIPGIDGNMLQQWAMRGANSAAYRKLLQAQEVGAIKQEKHYTELLSDRYFNDNYDAKKGTVTKPTYTPDSASTPTIDSEATAADILDDMRRLAMAAASNPDSLNSTHHDFFEQMRLKIAAGLDTGKKDDDKVEVIEDATAASVMTKTDYHLLTEDQNFTVAGAKGEKNYNFGTGTSLSSIVAAINADSEETGVKAEWVKNGENDYELRFLSTETGKDASVRVDQNVGDLFTGAGQTVKANGTDALTKEAETVMTNEDTQAAIAAGAYTGVLFGDQTFTIAGPKGSKQFSFAGGTSVEDVAGAINAASSELGVRAEVIRNSGGEIEGIGLVSDKAGSGQFVQVTQDKGDLFGPEGKTTRVTGSTNSKNGDSGYGITSTSDLGLVTIDGKTYSFADLGPGGSASLAKNPDAALAVLEQTLKDIYEGRASIKGFDPTTTAPRADYVVGTPSSTNTAEIGNYGSDAMTKWINNFIKETAEA